MNWLRRRIFLPVQAQDDVDDDDIVFFGSFGSGSMKTKRTAQRRR